MFAFNAWCFHLFSHCEEPVKNGWGIDYFILFYVPFMYVYFVHLPRCCLLLIRSSFLFKIFSERPWHATSNPGKSSPLGKGILFWDFCSCHHRKRSVDRKISFSFFFCHIWFSIIWYRSNAIHILCIIFPASWQETTERLKTFDGRRKIWYAFPYDLWMQ